MTALVEVVGLQTAPELNGKRGRVLGYDAETGRYRLRIKGEKTLDTLIQDVAACSARLHGHGSPAGFPVGPPQAAAAAPQ